MPAYSYIGTAVVELLCVALHVVDLSLDYRVTVNAASSMNLRWRCAVITLSTVDIVVALATGGTFVRFSRFARPVYLATTSQKLWSYFCLIWAGMKGLISVMLLIVFWVSVFACSCLILFTPGTVAREEHFSNARSAFDSFMFLIFGSVNFPDAMIPAFVQMGVFYVFWFIVFLFFGIFFILNMALAMIYVGYKKRLDSQFVKTDSRRRIGLMCAFYVLDVDGDHDQNSKKISR